MFAMRLANEHDKAIIRSAVGVSSASTIAFLSSIADREAIAFGEAIATPMRMKFSDYRLDERRAAPSAEPEPQMAHLDLRKIVCRLRGEYSGEFDVADLDRRKNCRSVGPLRQRPTVLARLRSRPRARAGTRFDVAWRRD